MSAVDRLARQGQGAALSLAGTLQDVLDERAHLVDPVAAVARVAELAARADVQYTRLGAQLDALRAALAAEQRERSATMDLTQPVADPAIGGAPVE